MPSLHRGAVPVNIREVTPPSRAPMRFTVATYNIHKGFTQLKRRMVIHELREQLHGLSADILFLQEVVGCHRGHAAATSTGRASRSTSSSPTRVWQEVAYGKNADLPPRAPRQRGAVALPDRRAREPGHLGARVREPRAAPLHDRARRRASRRCTASTSTSACSSAGGSGRSARCASASARRCPRTRRCSSPATSTTGGTRRTGCSSTSSASSRSSRRSRGRPARTFPSVLPVFRLDRIYARGLVDRRRARPLRVSLGPHLRPRGAGGDVRDPGSAAMNRFLAGQPDHAAEERRRVLSRAGRRDRSAPSARSGWRPTSTPTTTSAGSSRRRSSARCSAA